MKADKNLTIIYIILLYTPGTNARRMVVKQWSIKHVFVIRIPIPTVIQDPVIRESCLWQEWSVCLVSRKRFLWFIDRSNMLKNSLGFWFSSLQNMRTFCTSLSVEM